MKTIGANIAELKISRFFWLFWLHYLTRSDASLMLCFSSRRSIFWTSGLIFSAFAGLCRDSKATFRPSSKGKRKLEFVGQSNSMRALILASGSYFVIYTRTNAVEQFQEG
eukprot:Plantae.Rhodophyta-Hildenbrandia_rubra.ctg38787.p1 GENE.Plantae.Rhodophyta-Hildenbrandia_rubra.ctg38787~~Plantae.Rhodophyta-Hildenbrandia_rubra.ctg38787.p1  ORF type:complete len:110 (-),score=7.34 Plantae.Rhodophyta-Hildenbrandia_rubra.ctg38787:704-1033(-)